MSNQQEVYAAALMLKLYVSAYMSTLAEIVDGDDGHEQHEQALEWREEVEQALKEVDEIRARMAQAREDRDADEF